MTDDTEQLRALLAEWIEATEGADRDRAPDPLVMTLVSDVAKWCGFGASMHEMQRQWRQYLTASGCGAGGEFTVGPPRTTLHNLLERSRAALARQPAQRDRG